MSAFSTGFRVFGYPNTSLDQGDNDTVFIFFRQKDNKEDTNQNEWVPQIKCSAIPVAELIGAAGGEHSVWSEGFLYKVALPELKISPIMYVFVMYNSIVQAKVPKIIVPIKQKF